MLMNWGAYTKGSIIENMQSGQADLFIRRGIVRADPQQAIEFADLQDDGKREQAAISRKKRRNAIPQFDTYD